MALSSRAARATFVFPSLVALAVFAVPFVAADLAPGVRLDVETADATPWLTTMTGPQLCFLDDNDSGSYTPGEPVSLDPDGACGSPAGSLRMANFQGIAAGRIVSAQDPDGRIAHQIFPQATFLRYLDEDDNGRPSPGDVIYADVLNPSSGNVEAGDVRLNAYQGRPAGSHVQAGDPDVGRSVDVVGTFEDHLAYVDQNADNRWSIGDHAFMRGKPSSLGMRAAIGDLRLGGAVPEAFGTWVALGDPDAPADLQTLSEASVCYAKADGSYAVGDVVVLRSGACTGQAEAGAHLLAGASGNGSTLLSDDAATGAPLHPLTDARLMFREWNGIAGYGLGDWLYMDLTGSPTAVDPGDLRLTPHDGLPAAHAVRSGDVDAGLTVDTLGDLSTYVGFVDTDVDGSFGHADLAYLDADGSGVGPVERGDTRLGTHGGVYFFGSQVTEADPEVPRRLRDGALQVCLLDTDGDGLFDADEVLYVNPDGCGELKATALRLTASESGPQGVKVRGGSEVGQNTAVPNFQLSFHDADLSTTWTRGDVLYFSFGTTQDRVSVGDVRLTAFQDHTGMEGIRSDSADLNLPLRQLQSGASDRLSFFDVDGDGAYGEDDPVYLNTVAALAETASYGMVRLSVLQGPQPMPTIAPTPSPTASPTEDPTMDPTPSPTDSPPAQTLTDTPGPDGEDDEPPRTPGPAILVVLAAIGAVLWLSRRP